MLYFTYSKPDLDCKGAKQTGRGSCDIQEKVLCEAIALAETRLPVCSLPSSFLPGCLCASLLSSGLPGILATPSRRAVRPAKMMCGWGDRHL